MAMCPNQIEATPGAKPRSRRRLAGRQHGGPAGALAELVDAELVERFERKLLGQAPRREKKKSERRDERPAAIGDGAEEGRVGGHESPSKSVEMTGRASALSSTQPRQSKRREC